MRDIAHPEKLAQDHPADWEHGQMMTREQALASARQIFASSATIRAEPLRSRIIPPPRAATSIHILALGSAEVRRGDMSLTTADWTYLKAKELLMYLLNYRMRTKGQICLALWPDADPEQVRSYLRVVIYHLRRALGDASRIISTNNGYAFDYAQEYWYDVEEFEAGIAQATRQAANAPDHAIPLLEDACMLYRGAYLEDLPLREWIMQRQREIQQQYLDALVLLGQLYLNNDQPHRALETLQKVIAHDPYQEIAHRIIIKCYATLGERSQALRYYRELSNQLYQHLGAQPDPQTTALITCLLERD